LEGGGCCIGKELVLEPLAEEKVGEVMRLKVDGSVKTVCEVQWELGGKRCDGDKGEGTNTAGSTKGLTVVGRLGDWDIGVWGLEGGGCCIGKELVLEMLAEEKVGRVRRLTVEGAIETV
jgi:hypothetical protein